GTSHGGRRRPAGEFPAGTVALCQRGDRPAGQPARDADRAETATPALAGHTEPDAATSNDNALSTAERQELAARRPENRRPREDVEILKRATVIVATLTR